MTHEPPTQTRLSIATLFALDAAGAITSALLLGVVLMRLEHLFGMPAHALYVFHCLHARQRQTAA